MANIKINDLNLAGAVSDTMQLETDTGGSAANKITVAQLSSKILSTDLKFKATIENAIQTSNSGLDGLNESNIVLKQTLPNEFQLLTGTTDLLVTTSCTIDQNLSTASDVEFNALSLINEINEFSTDGTLSGNSDLAVPTEKAVKTYIDDISFGNRQIDQLTISGDGQTAFTLSQTPLDPALDVYLNGLWNGIRGTDYNQTGISFTWLDYLGVTLKTTDSLVVEYLY